MSHIIFIAETLQVFLYKSHDNKLRIYDTETNLHNSIVMITHSQFWYIAHQIVKPIVNASENVYGLAHITAVIKHTCIHTDMYVTHRNYLYLKITINTVLFKLKAKLSFKKSEIPNNNTANQHYKL